jgi:hypothetical protein
MNKDFLSKEVGVISRKMGKEIIKLEKRRIAQTKEQKKSVKALFGMMIKSSKLDNAEKKQVFNAIKLLVDKGL